MKRILLIFIILCFNSRLFSQTCNTCSTVTGGPYLGSCHGDVDRYLARSIMMLDLPHERWWGSATVYCNSINMLADLNAAYISRAVGVWGNEDWTIPGSAYMTHAQQTINDINKAYNCANLRTPVIEAAILEHITNAVNTVPIPTYVLNEFQLDPDFNSLGYNLPGTHYFLQTNIAYPSTNNVDISKLTARMWFYYLATQYIDMGCQGLHMGWLGLYSANDPSHLSFIEVCNKIRVYAASSPMRFVLINVDHSYEITDPSTNNLVLDFLSTPIRPDETYYYNSYDGLPCQSSFYNHNSELNFYKFIKELDDRKGGMSPNGCYYDKTPVLFNFDWYGPPYSAWTQTHNGWNPWGTDEMSLYNSLTDDCQGFVLESFAHAIKNDVKYRGYLKIPGRAPNWAPMSGNWLPHYQLLDHPIVLNVIKNKIWNVNDRTNFTITESCEKACDEKQCDKPRMVTGQKTYTLRVTNPDGSSVYSWHVYCPKSSSWLPVVYGTERVLTNMTSDMYQVHLRQDNFGFSYPQDVFEMRKDWPMDSEACCRNMENKPDFGKLISNEDYGKRTTPVATSMQKPLADRSNGLTNFTIYPNPANNQVTIEFTLPDDSQVDVILRSIEGQVISQLETGLLCRKGKTTLNRKIGNVPSGTYLVDLIVDKKTTTKKLIVIN